MNIDDLDDIRDDVDKIISSGKVNPCDIKNIMNKYNTGLIETKAIFDKRKMLKNVDDSNNIEDLKEILRVLIGKVY